MHIETEATQQLHRAAIDAREAARVLARSSEATRNAALTTMATALRDRQPAILVANEADVGAFNGTNAFRDRLTLTPDRVEAMAKGLEDIAALPDPLARTLADWTRPNGLRIQRVAAPIGVIGMIYESRPNVARTPRPCASNPATRLFSAAAPTVPIAPKPSTSPCNRAWRHPACRQPASRSRPTQTEPLWRQCWRARGCST